MSVIHVLIREIKPKRSLYIQLLITALAFAAMVVLSYFFISRIIQKELVRNTETVLAFEQAKTESDVQEHAGMLDIIAHSVRNMILHGDYEDKIHGYFNEIAESMASSEKHMNCFMGIAGYFEMLPGGPFFIESFVWDRLAGYHPKERPWYINAVAANGDVAETLSYEDIITGETVLIYSQCIFDDEGRLLGVIVLRIRMATLGREIVETSLAQGGYGMLISRDLIILAHENQDYVGRSMHDPTLPISNLADELQKGVEISERSVMSYKGEKSVAFFRRLSNGWYFGLVAPKRPYYHNATNMISILSMLGAAFTVLLSIILIRIDAAREKSDTESRHKSAFLANMSHEIRTPLNAIIGMTTIGKSAANSERKDYCFSKVEDASNHLLGVINDILDMSKIEANKFELVPDEFDFEKMLQRVVNVVNFRMDEKQHKFTVHIDRDIPKTMIGDDQRLAQVITNLLGNAIKFTPEQGSITLNTRFVEEDEKGCTVQISITDTGIGINPAQQERLFTSFEQAESSTTRKFGGTGLGLSISKNIVELMGGKIWVHSEPEKGSTFAFTFMMKRGSVERQRLLARGINWGNVRIMAVDDDPDILKYFNEIAQGLGIFCETAISGDEALRLVAQNGICHIYFVDWKMPGMDGIQLARELKGRVSANSVVIMISAAEWSKIAEEAKKAGVDKFLSKPLFPSAISDAISESLGLGQRHTEEAQLKIDGIFAGRRILLAEDVEINREIVLALLEPTQLEIECAENGAEAVRIFNEAPEKYELILMDVQMPEMDGYDATRRIRAIEQAKNKKPYKRAPIIAMTANVFVEDVNRCLEAGMDDHIGKPLDFNIVMEKLRHFLK
ncbi:MAG: response regulator [Treponema sp.]|jgi:signal transduction histidine kinase/CheY-like chemotaxis protein|nr:response regulator [Treponema sp.]